MHFLTLKVAARSDRLLWNRRWMCHKSNFKYHRHLQRKSTKRFSRPGYHMVWGLNIFIGGKIYKSKYNNFMIKKLSSSSWQAIFGFCGIFVLIVGVIYKQNAQLLQLQRLDVGSLFYLIKIFKEKWQLWRPCQILKAISTNTVMKNRNSPPGTQWNKYRFLL